MWFIFCVGDGRGCLHRPPDAAAFIVPLFPIPRQGEGGSCLTTTNRVNSATLVLTPPYEKKEVVNDSAIHHFFLFICRTKRYPYCRLALGWYSGLFSYRRGHNLPAIDYN